MSKEDTRTRFTFRIPDPLLQKLKQESNEFGVSINALILQILWSWIKENTTE